MRYAIIDIGSSIIKYQTYEYEENKIEPIIAKDKATRLISYRKDGYLTNEGIKVLIETLREFQYYNRKLAIDEAYYYATASLRKLKNKEYVISKVKKELNININIITGIEESQLSFKSIEKVELPQECGVMIDIGGGSSEVTIFNEKEVEKQASMPIGVLVIFNNYIKMLLPQKDEQDEILNVVNEELESLKLGDYSKKYLYGIGKTFKVMKRVLEFMKIKEDAGYEFSIQDVDIALERLSGNSKEKFMPLLQVDSERIHTVVPSMLITKAVCSKFNITNIYVCDCTLQDGLLYDILEKK